MDINSEVDELAISKSSEHGVEDEAGKSLNGDNEENDLNMVNTRPKTCRKIIDSDSEVNDSADDLKKNLNEYENECAQLQSNLHAVDEEKLNKSADMERENKDATFKTKTKQSDDSNVEEESSISLNQDDEENDLNIINTRPKTYRKIVDSDSEVDESSTDGIKKNMNEPENDCAQPQSNLQAIEEEELNKSVDMERENKDVTFKTKPKRIAIIDSDSEDETPHNKSFSEDLNAANKNATSATVDNHNKDELLNPENKIDDTVMQKSRIAALCDSESSEDEREHSVEHERWPESPPKGKPYSKRSKKPDEEPSQKKMSGKEALQQRNEIRSESQRMLRESRLSLPYHKPKSHSIKEFLQNRPRLSLLKTNNTPPSLAMKMSTEQLKIVSEKLEERKKEVEKFYKSESESEEEKEEVEDQKNEESNEPSGVSNEETAEIISEDLQMEEKETEQLEHNDKAPTFDVSIEDANLPSAHSESPMEVSESTVDVANEQLLLTSSDELQSNQGTCEFSTLKDDLPKTPNQMLPENSEAVESQTNALLEGSCNSMEYDFNLDDVEDFSENPVEPKEKNIEEDYLQRLLKKYDAADNPVQPLNDNSKKLSKAELLKQLGSDKPRLSGGPNEEIDLEEGAAKPSEVAKLMERFLQHTAKKTVARNKIQVDVINLSQGEVRKETVAVSVDPEEEAMVITEKPGVKLQKLRTELQSQMAQRRSELWQQKQQPVSAGETKDACDDEKSDCGADEDLLDDEEEAELTDGETTDEEEEDDDGYVEKPEKARVQSAFIEDEAEESDAEESGAEQNDVTSQNKESGDENATESNENGQTRTKKPLRRILKGFTEDSDDEDKESDLDQTLPKATDARSISAASTDTWEDDEPLLPNQPRLDKTPHRQRTPSKPDLGFLTPVIHLTGLQGLNSGSKFLRESPVSPFSLPPDPSPLKEKNWNTTLQKKLFTDSCEALDSEANMEEIAQMCSGKFAETQPKPDSVDCVTTQDLLSICSGSFSGISVDTESNNLVKDLPPATDKSDVEFRSIAKKPSSQMISLNLDAVEVKDLDDDRLISELLDEEEMEQFKKKFESPGALDVNTISNFDEGAGEVKGGGILFDSSDEESELTETTKKNVKKLHKKLTFSDDESNSELEEEDNDEEISLCDDLSDEDDAPVSKVVDYDSEENEVEIDNEEGIPQNNLKPSDFFEDEAELSESDWDSADEDEKGLDALEFEQGDAEVFDENKIRSDLEKIHMRQVLDQDNQEIKILQELLLEDGELHGTGRQRQFRWKNIDDAGNDENAQGNADLETYLDEEESEEQWRRARHEREMFLKNKQEKQTSLQIDDLILDDSNSQVIKMGQEAVRKSLSAAAAPADNPKKASAASLEIKKPLILMNTRGSFLARNDKFLTRLAEFTKSTTSVVIGGAKKSKNFVFQTVTEDFDESVNESSSFNKKRKAVDGTPTFIKKLRLNSEVSPAVNNSKRKKQLFE